MKKLLIGLTILFSFLFINNVSAESLDNTNIFEHIHLTNLYGLTDSEMLELGNSVGVDLTNFIQNYNIHKSKLTLTNFFFNYENGTGITIFYKDTDTWTLNLKDNTTYYSFYIEDRNPTYKISVKYNSWSGSTLISPSQSAYTFGSINNIQKNSANEYYLFYISDIEEDIYLKYTTGYNGSGYMTNNITINDIIYSINDTTSINFKVGYNSLIIKEPQLDISVIEKTEHSENIKINFNIWDTEKYIYQYKLTGMEVWEDINENDFKYISYSNNTIYIQMIDKTTNESVLNATYTFSNITETIPDITFNESIPNSCKVLKNGTNYIVCKEIKANFNNYYGINNYLWSYSDDSENWTQIYNDKFIDLISENKAIYFKLYDRNTNETLKYMTYNITGVELIPSDLGQYITFNGKYENNNYKLDIIFYNYDNELYNYYYSTDGENWTQLNIGELSNYTSIYSKYKSFNFYKDMTIYVKIEDKEANYITSATYEIKIPNVGLFDTINNFKVDNNILNYFTNIYNQIRTSDLGNYVFILIVTSIILLIIKSARR